MKNLKSNPPAKTKSAVPANPGNEIRDSVPAGPFQREIDRAQEADEEKVTYKFPANLTDAFALLTQERDARALMRKGEDAAIAAIDQKLLALGKHISFLQNGAPPPDNPREFHNRWLRSQETPQRVIAEIKNAVLKKLENK